MVAAKILVVDDNKQNQVLISNWLARAGYQYTISGDGVSALDLIKRERFDLVILDLFLPKMNGMEVVKRLQHQSAVPPVLVFSCTLVDYTEDELRSCGIRYFLGKPFSGEHLLKKVSEILKAL